MRPDNAPARAQIARAYFALKETDTAGASSRTSRSRKCRAEVRQTIDRYLDAIDRIAETEKFKARFFVEFAFGWDSNVNSATRIDSVAVPAFGNSIFTLAPGSIEQHDMFFSVGAGTNISNPLGRNWTLIGGPVCVQAQQLLHGRLRHRLSRRLSRRGEEIRARHLDPGRPGQHVLRRQQRLQLRVSRRGGRHAAVGARLQCTQSDHRVRPVRLSHLSAAEPARCQPLYRRCRLCARVQRRRSDRLRRRVQRRWRRPRTRASTIWGTGRSACAWAVKR